MKVTHVLGFALALTVFVSCKEDKKEPVVEVAEVKVENTFDYNVEQFADIKLLRYQIPGWENLTLKEQKLVYYLTQAGLAGRDIIWDQNYRHNLKIRTALENIYIQFTGDKTADDWKAFETYIKRIWFSNGIHHHYSNDKIMPEFSADYLTFLLSDTDT